MMAQSTPFHRASFQISITVNNRLVNKNPVFKKKNSISGFLFYAGIKRKTLGNLREDEERGKHTDGIWEISSNFSCL